MEILKSLLVAAVCVSPSWAQVVVENIVVGSPTADSIDLEAADKSGGKNVWGAAFMSLAIPGVGQFYLEDKKKGAAYLSADLVLLAGVLFSEATSRRSYKNSMNYARINAGTLSDRGWQDNYWKEIGSGDSTIMSSADWNRDKSVIGRDFDGFYNGSDSWDWGYSMDAKNNYNDQRVHASNWHTASFAFLGGMVVNRIVSFVDARVSANRYNNKLVNGTSFTSFYSPFDNKTHVVVSGCF